MNNTIHRRQFLQFGAVAAVAAAMAPHSAFSAAATPKRKLKKAIMYSTIGVKGTVLEKFTAMKAAGFEGVEPIGGMDRKEVIDALQATGLKAASVCCHTHWSKPLSDPNPEVRKIGYTGMELSLQDAKAYGAGSVLLVPGVAKNGVGYDDCFKRSVAEIKKLVPIAKDVGVKIAVENVWNDFITKPEQAVDFMDAIDSKWVGWHFDIGNVGRYSPAETWIPLLGKRIVRLHIKEFNTKAMEPGNPGKGFGFKLMEGDNNWPAIVAALDKVHYEGWGISEQPGSQAATVETATDLAQRMDKIFAS
ncbi:MAG TPA: sugar phosphate isomerase/epimerase family protein [Roseimicrobium sp.]|nr:sugar phosphate isomerase/epimerase family protein [Roseimicrobium sp.]